MFFSLYYNNVAEFIIKEVNKLQLFILTPEVSDASNHRSFMGF